MMTIIILVTIWYLLGSIGSSYVMYKDFGYLTLRDLIICFSLGGFGGIISLLIAIIMTDFGDKEYFKK